MEGPGAPIMIDGGDLDCFLLINWKSRALCDQYEIAQYEKNKPSTSTQRTDIIDPSGDHKADDNDGDVVITPGDTGDSTAKKKEEQADDSVSGSSWGYVVALVLLMCLAIYVYKSDRARNNLFRIITEVRAKMPVYLGGRAHRDSSFLISGYNAPNSGFLDDDDDYT